MKTPKTQLFVTLALSILCSARALEAEGNMRRIGSMTIDQSADDTRGFYAAAIDPTNGYAYFASRYVYKVDISGALPVQIGAGVSLVRQAGTAVMDPSAGCAYVANSANIYQINANGSGAPTLGGTMPNPAGSSAAIWSLLIDTSDAANHFLYAMCQTSGGSQLYKIALNSFPNAAAAIGSASTVAGEPALGAGAIDSANHYAYFTPILGQAPPYIVKFALGSGASAPSHVGGVMLENVNRGLGCLALDTTAGYGYCTTDGSTEVNFGKSRVYMFALNGAGAPAIVTNIDLNTNQGCCPVALIKPEQKLLYFGADLSYPGQVFRLRLGTGGGPPVEAGVLLCRNTTNNLTLPPWGTNPPFTTNDWGEVYLHSGVYDPVRQYAYFGRDCADAQSQPYHDQIVKVALDRDEMVFMLAKQSPNTNNPIPYAESFESYSNGFSLGGSNGWFDTDPAGALVVSNKYSSNYAGFFPIGAPHNLDLAVDGVITNRFTSSAFTNIWIDAILQARFWTDPFPPGTNVLGDAPFALLFTTNGHVAVWNRLAPANPGNGWTELTDTSVASNQFARLTIQAAYNRDAYGEFYYRVWLNGVASTNPVTWHAAADTAQNSFGAIVAQGRFSMDDLVVRNTDPFGAPSIFIAGIARNPDGAITLHCVGVPNQTHRALATTNLSGLGSWQAVTTNLAGPDGSFEFADPAAAGNPRRFYRAVYP